MVALLVVSPNKATGKTAICAGLARYFLASDKKVGYLRAVAGVEPIEAGQRDATFMKQLLALTEDVEFLCPQVSDGANPTGKINEAYAKVAKGKDLVIIEGVSGTDDNVDPFRRLAEALTGKVVVVENYSAQPAKPNYEGFGNNLLGIILNKVPKSQLKRVRDQALDRLGGIGILGVIPEDRTLLSLSVAQLAASVQGKILNSVEKSAELVENFMVGAMCVDSGLDYFGRKTSKAAIIRSDRPDMQLAALETPCRCLILSQTTPLIHHVLFKAEHKDVPIIVTESSIDDIIVSVEAALSKAKFNQEKKLPRLAEIMQEHLDFKAVTSGLGLAS